MTHLPNFFTSLNQPIQNTKHKFRLIETKDHPIQKTDLEDGEWFVINKLRERGHKVFVWGGKIRDKLLQKSSRDTDLLTTATPVEIQEIFKGNCRQYSGSINSITISFNHASPSYSIDVNSLYPIFDTKSDYAAALAAFINNSDYTCNTFILDIDSWALIFHPKHMELLQKGIMQTVAADAVASLSSDPSRILRGIRISYETGLHFGTRTAQAIASCKKYIKNLDDIQFNKHLELLITSCGINNTLDLLNQYQLARDLVRLAKVRVNHFSLNHISQTPFIEALYADDFKRFKTLLVTHPHLINKKDEYGNTAAHIMVTFNREKYLRYLLANGASIYSKNNAGISPLQLAQATQPVNNQLSFTH